MPTLKTERQGVAGMSAIARDVSVPFGGAIQEFRYLQDLIPYRDRYTGKRYIFELTTVPNVIWADLTKFDLQPGAPVMMLHPDNIDLSGDVSTKFERAAAPF
jgi:penicillin V acylase-like amidase (Ntn superfamily)